MDTNIIICKNATLAQAIASNYATRTGIPNEPDPIALENIKYVGSRVFDVMVAYFANKYKVKVPLKYASWFRAPLINKGVGGSKTSFHMTGGAIDIQSNSPKITNAEIYHYVKDNLLFTELIWEYGTPVEPSWVHVAILRGRENEKAIKNIYNKDGKKITEIVKKKTLG